MKHGLLCGASFVAVTMVAGLWATQAQAQTGAAAAAAPAPQGNSADVLVVANKREASVEKVPVAVTA
ncbi:MAG TPA: hypothetical protein VKU90_00450, partial [Caulobacteraceae bacterium]|nr:hypothetical protein [Caulobacteraceae bacterium]